MGCPIQVSLSPVKEIIEEETLHGKFLLREPTKRGKSSCRVLLPLLSFGSRASSFWWLFFLSTRSRTFQGTLPVGVVKLKNRKRISVPFLTSFHPRSPYVSLSRRALVPLLFNQISISLSVAISSSLSHFSLSIAPSITCILSSFHSPSPSI